MFQCGKMKTTSKIGPPPFFFAPRLNNYLKFYWWPLVLTATPQLMLNRKWYQASKPEIEFNIINMMYVALPRHPQTEKTTFSCKDDCILTKQTRRWTYSPLRLQYDLCRPSCIKPNYRLGWVVKLTIFPYNDLLHFRTHKLEFLPWDKSGPRLSFYPPYRGIEEDLV